MVINTDNYANIINKRYLYHYLSSLNYSSIVSGSGQPQIVRTPLLKQKILLPNIVIQNKLATYLDSILYKIDIEQDILFKYLQKKQYLLMNIII